MSAPAQHGCVETNDQTIDIDIDIDIDELMREIERYLVAIEVFRAAGRDVGGLRRREGPNDERWETAEPHSPVMWQ